METDRQSKGGNADKMLCRGTCTEKSPCFHLYILQTLFSIREVNGLGGKHHQEPLCLSKCPAIWFFRSKAEVNFGEGSNLFWACPSISGVRKGCCLRGHLLPLWLVLKVSCKALLFSHHLCTQKLTWLDWIAIISSRDAIRVALLASFAN